MVMMMVIIVYATIKLQYPTRSVTVSYQHGKSSLILSKNGAENFPLIWLVNAD
jgi:hypothetical protein